MKYRRLVLGACAAAGFILYGCGGGDGSDNVVQTNNAAQNEPTDRNIQTGEQTIISIPTSNEYKQVSYLGNVAQTNNVAQNEQVDRNIHIDEPTIVSTLTNNEYIQVSHLDNVIEGEYRVYNQCKDPILSGIVRDEANNGFIINMSEIKTRLSGSPTGVGLLGAPSGAYKVFINYKHPITGKYVKEQEVKEFLNITTIDMKVCDSEFARHLCYF
jgi:hypothetical protein